MFRVQRKEKRKRGINSSIKEKIGGEGKGRKKVRYEKERTSEKHQGIRSGK